MVAMKPIEIHDNIRKVLKRRPDLRAKDSHWSPEKQKELSKIYGTINFPDYQGFCYVATYAFCHLVPEARPYTIDRSHFWAQIDDEIWDLTKEQFNYDYPYHEGRKLPRKSRPTKRVQEILKELNAS